MSQTKSIDLKEHNTEYVYANFRILVHPVQKKIFELFEQTDISKMTLRGIGEHVGVTHPQKVKHHLNQLVKMGVFDYISGKYIKHK